MSKLKILSFIIANITLVSCMGMWVSDPTCGKPDGPIINAVMAEDINLLKKHIKNGENINELYKKGICGDYHGGSWRINYSALHEAINKGNYDIVRLLVENEANIYQKNHNLDGEYPRTPFKLAVNKNKVEIAIYLWERIKKNNFKPRVSKRNSFKRKIFKSKINKRKISDVNPNKLELDMLSHAGSLSSRWPEMKVFKYIVNHSSKSMLQNYLDYLQKRYEIFNYAINKNAMLYLNSKGYSLVENKK